EDEWEIPRHVPAASQPPLRRSLAQVAPLASCADLGNRPRLRFRLPPLTLVQENEEDGTADPCQPVEDPGLAQGEIPKHSQRGGSRLAGLKLAHARRRRRYLRFSRGPQRQERIEGVVEARHRGTVTRLE